MEQLPYKVRLEGLGWFSLEGQGCGKGYNGVLWNHNWVDKENAESFFTALHNIRTTESFIKISI